MRDNIEIIETLRNGLLAAKEQLRAYETFVEEYRTGSLVRMTFLKQAPHSDQILVAGDRGILSIPFPPDFDKEALTLGATVWVTTKGEMVTACSAPEPSIESRVASVSDSEVYVSSAGAEQAKLVMTTKDIMESLVVGDTVLLDPFSHVILKKVSKKQSFTAFTEVVNWSDIGGLQDAKKDMIEAIEMPLTHSEIFKRYGKKPIKGVLLYGPPGCGKTMLGKAAATAVAKMFGTAKVPGFFYVKGPEVLSKWVGETEATIRSLFTKAREFKKATGSPATIFLDEAEALLHARRSDSLSGMSMTVVPTFLAEMDGLDDSGAMVLLSTNRPDSLDPAIVRDGRIDTKVHVPRPSQEDAQDIFSKYLSKIPHQDKDLAEILSNEIFSDKHSFYYLTTREGQVKKFGLQHIISGAMVAGIVEKAISMAMHREIENSGRAGVQREDLFHAVDRTFRENRDGNHDSDMRTFIEGLHVDVIKTQRAP